MRLAASFVARRWRRQQRLVLPPLLPPSASWSSSSRRRPPAPLFALHHHHAPPPHTQPATRRLSTPWTAHRTLSTTSGSGGGGGDAATEPSQPHPALAVDEVERLEEMATVSWRASRELGMRYLTYGKRLGSDAEKALEWLEKAGKQQQQQQQSDNDDQGAKPSSSGSSESSEPPASEEETRELWYARALACRRVDQGLGAGAVVEGEGEWEDEVETERYGARTGVEFVRVVRRRANKLKQARAKESVAARVAPKHKRALLRFERAAELGHVEAMIQMGNIFYECVEEEEEESKEGKEGAGDKTNLQRAVECYQRAATEGAEGGHPDAWYNLGTILYEGGPGVPRDVPTALECFHAAAACPQETSGSAAYWLGHLYRLGERDAGVAPNRDKALRFLQQACDEKKHPAACYYLALLFRNGERSLSLLPDPKAFQTYLQRAEALGDPEALHCLADMHLRGTDGVERDEARAMDYYKEAGAQGHGGALTSLGALMHQKGRYEEALQLYERAGELGSLDAWRNLASMYMLGQGVPKNEGMARHILKTIAKAEKEEGEG